jgi:hypothetical protein
MPPPILPVVIHAFIDARRRCRAAGMLRARKPLNSQPTLQELVDEVDEIGHQPTRLIDYKSPTRLNYLTNQSVIS